MGLPQPLTISQTAQQLKTQLSTWATTAGGKAVVVSNTKDMWEQASQNTQTPLVLICYNGETIRGERAVSALNHRVERNWIVAVTRGRGWNIERGASLYKTTQNADPFYDVVEECRDQIRVLTGISEEWPVEFLRISPMSSGNKALDAYAIEFTVAADIPAVYLTNPNTPS